MMPEIEAQEPEITNDAIAPVPEIIQPAPVSEESTPAPSSGGSTPQEESSPAATGEGSTPVLPHEEAQEEQTSRGFFNRLLRRGSD